MPRQSGLTTLPADRIEPVRPVRLYKQVVDQLLGLIESGELAPGDRLPAERALADQLQVSRASVRQALTALEISGAVQVKAGSGVYVSEPSGVVDEVAATLTESAGPLEILESRSLFEPGVAALAAARRNDDDLVAMHSLVQAMENELAQGRDGWDADWGFHEALGRATSNPSIERLIRDLRDQMGQQVWSLMRTRNLQRAVHAKRYLKDHAAILRAVERGDTGRSETLMAKHISNVLRDLNSTFPA
jgi:GntR family transcriptional regulator, transcriptional repressor for pyruvate dehydrogenase complex